MWNAPAEPEIPIVAIIRRWFWRWDSPILPPPQELRAVIGARATPRDAPSKLGKISGQNRSNRLARRVGFDRR